MLYTVVAAYYNHGLNYQSVIVIEKCKYGSDLYLYE